MTDRIPPPLTVFRSLGIDHERGLVVFETHDSTTEEHPLPNPPNSREVGLRRSVYDTASRRLLLTLPHGEKVTIQLPDRGAPPAKPQRPVVYLDQLHWIALAQQVHSPEKLGDDERSAAERMIDLARTGKITLPISSANVVETTKMSGRHRHHLSVLLLELSGGWHMRNPAKVRGLELRASLADKDPRASDVITLEPGMHSAGETDPPEAPSGYPEEWAHWYRDSVLINSLVSTLADGEALPITEGEKVARRWGEKHERLATYMREQGTSKENARLNAQAMLISDLSTEIASAAEGLSLEQAAFDQWLEGRFESDLGRMPYLGRHNEVIYHRLRDAGDRWSPNDLFDLNFLCCAAGYADIVVGEKKFSSYLERTTSRVPDGAFVCAKLTASIKHVESMLAGERE